ncbi:MAG: transglycosylase domain-containing protein, partial [Pseudomonadota bacterium]
MGSFVLIDWMSLGRRLPSADQSQQILDRYGQEIRHALNVQGERQYILPLDTVPEIIKKSFIQAEDKTFWAHRGVDWRALCRWPWTLLKSRGQTLSGGSTITMQLSRIHWARLRHFWHRPAQILQALRLERNYSKKEILEQYLNTVPFGNKIAGVGAACYYFFDKDCSRLSLAESATLAILPRNPSLIRNLSGLKKRRDNLLQQLLGDSDQKLTEQAQHEPIKIVKKVPPFFAPHFTERVLADNPEKTRAVIHTTIDLELQKQIQNLLRTETQTNLGTGDSGAVLVVDNQTGEILAYVGSPDFFETNHGMVDATAVKRSPGSALKPFVYELALENNWNLFS